MLDNSNFDKFPEVVVHGYEGCTGWTEIIAELKGRLNAPEDSKKKIVVECYHGVDIKPFVDEFSKVFPSALLVDAKAAMLSEEQINTMVYPYVTDDPVFGYMSPLSMPDFFNADKIKALKEKVADADDKLICIYGAGASLITPDPDILVYADMPRWEIQLRFRRHEAGNFGADNSSSAFSYLYKRAFFVDWRVFDRFKVGLFDKWDYALDTTVPGEPKMVTADALFGALKQVAERPFRVVPFFDPGPWGGQWLKEVCDLERSAKNFAWGFDCVPEENSLLIRFDHIRFETPSINLVFYKPEQLLGRKVYEAFGAEFPIRFDFLDTMEGGNLSLQVHPLKEYIREKFGMAYTQDESYYFLEAQDDAFVYLGLKENIVPEKMLQDLESAQKNGGEFQAEQYVDKWPIKKHDHVLIPAGTIHCSGANSVVLEISATPYIFTFKLWDWGRMGMDGKPRPISLEHGKNSIQWDRTTEWTKNNIVNRIETIAEGDGWKEERTGLDKDSFIETRRHWFTKKVAHDTGGVVNILNLVEGREAIVESPTNAFAPFIIHYAETFIVPAQVGAYTVRPYGKGEGTACATMKAYVRKENLINYRIN